MEDAKNLLVNSHDVQPAASASALLAEFDAVFSSMMKSEALAITKTHIEPNKMMHESYDLG